MITVQKFITENKSRDVSEPRTVPYNERLIVDPPITGGTVTREITADGSVEITLSKEEVEQYVHMLIARHGMASCNMNPGTDAVIVRAAARKQLQIEQLLERLDVKFINGNLD